MDPDSGFSNRHVVDRNIELILVCREGYSSSLAGVSLRGVGHARVADLVGGYEAWRDAGLETIPATPPPEGLPGMGGPDR